MNSVGDEQRQEGLRRESNLWATYVGDGRIEPVTFSDGLSRFFHPDELIDRIDNPTFQDTVDDVLGEARDLIVSRQRTYGNSNIEQQGVLGVVNRIALDKLARIRKRLHGSVINGEVVLEDIELGSVDEPGIVNDAYDVIGYAVCLILLLRGEWGMPLAEEVE